MGENILGVILTPPPNVGRVKTPCIWIPRVEIQWVTGLAFPPFISKEEMKTKTNSITNAHNSKRSGADSGELFHVDF